MTLTLKAGSIPEMPLREGRLTHVDRNSTCDIWFGNEKSSYGRHQLFLLTQVGRLIQLKALHRPLIDDRPGA
jgi:hypothetical protein